MSRLYIIHDFSSSAAALFAAFHHNKANLAKYGIALGPFNKNIAERLPTHISYWNNYASVNQVSDAVKKLWESLKNSLDGGQNILLYSHVLYHPGHLSFFNLLDEYQISQKHDIRSLFIIGKPAYFAESRFRQQVNFTQGSMDIIIDRINNLHNVIRLHKEKTGADNVTLVQNLTDSSKSCLTHEQVQKVREFLNIPDLQPLPHTPDHRTAFISCPAHHLFEAKQARLNKYPIMDEGIYLDVLKECDQIWSRNKTQDFFLPLTARKEFAKNARSGILHLAQLLEVSPESLQPSSDFMSQKDLEISPDLKTELPRQYVDQFLARLPKGIKEPFKQRLKNDWMVLTPTQKVILKALNDHGETKAPENPEYGEIGEPELPVELTVLTMTYNHEKYIGECMESVLAQKAPFPIHHIVLDHASQDATPQIITEYAARHPSIKPVLLSLRKVSENVYGLFERCRTKYAALCDGDDYFINPLKLQKQVDFLEKNSDCALCFHPVEMRFENNPKNNRLYPPLEMLPRGVKQKYYLSDLFKGNMIQTSSAVYRWRFTQGLPGWFRPDLTPGDWYWHFLHAELGKIGFLSDEAMSVYRRHNSAIFSTTSISRKEHRRKYGMKELEAYKAINDHFNNRYFSSISLLANAVFVNYLEIEIEDDDPSMFEAACNAYPEFGREFLRKCSEMQKGLQKSAAKPSNV